MVGTPLAFGRGARPESARAELVRPRETIAPMSITSILVYLLFGFLIGALARFLVPGKDPMAWWQTILLGITGSVVGGWIGSLVDLGISGSILGVPIAGLLLGTGGAVLVLLVLRWVR